MHPIPPASFYGMTTVSSTASDIHYEPQIDPVLLCDSTNASRPPSAQPVALPSGPPLGSTRSKARKPREEFSTKDLEHLLRAVIDVNPYMAPRNKVGERWKAVATMVQADGLCLNRDAETLKNKVTSLLGWVQVSRHVIFYDCVRTDPYAFGRGEKKPQLAHHLPRSWSASHLHLPPCPANSTRSSTSKHRRRRPVRRRRSRLKR
jgi:hypothetical protein